MEGYCPATIACASVLLLLQLQVSALQWSSCGEKTDSIQLAKLTVIPEVLQLPGSVTINALAKLRENITEPVKVDLEVQKKMFWGGYVRIPCEDGFGSCTYDDVCKFSPYKDVCPAIFDKYHIPCKCPIKQDTYSVKGLTLHVESGHIPKFLVNGKYKIHVSISLKDQQIGCYDVQVSLK